MLTCLLLFKQVTVWAGEMIVEAILVSVLVFAAAVLSTPSDYPAWNWSYDWRILLMPVFVLFIYTVSGYSVTRLISRLLLTGRRIWTPAFIAAALFLVHYAIVTHFGLTFFWQICTGGPIIAFLVTMRGSLLLRRWLATPRIGTVVEGRIGGV